MGVTKNHEGPNWTLPAAAMPTVGTSVPPPVGGKVSPAVDSAVVRPEGHPAFAVVLPGLLDCGVFELYSYIYF